ncbi:hypothetical protein UA75_28840 [Actinoalloteichus sp. GBA129-24]|nr:hypothetical protein UA75_28840 [Actinoalloteichus sp. GBA129-24]
MLAMTSAEVTKAGMSRSARIRHQIGDATFHAQQRPYRISGLQQSADDHGALRDHQTSAAGAVGSSISGGEIAEVVHLRVVGV